MLPLPPVGAPWPRRRGTLSTCCSATSCAANHGHGRRKMRIQQTCAYIQYLPLTHILLIHVLILILVPIYSCSRSRILKLSRSVPQTPRTDSSFYGRYHTYSRSTSREASKRPHVYSYIPHAQYTAYRSRYPSFLPLSPSSPRCTTHVASA